MRPFLMSCLLALSGSLAFATDVTITYQVAHKPSPQMSTTQVRISDKYYQEMVFGQMQVHDYAADLVFMVDAAGRVIQPMKVQGIYDRIAVFDQAFQEARMPQLMGDPEQVKDVKITKLKNLKICNRECQQIRIACRGVVADVAFDPTLQPGLPVEKVVRFKQAEAAMTAEALYLKTPVYGAMIRVWGEIARVPGVVLRSEITLPPDKVVGQATVTITEAVAVTEGPIPMDAFMLPKDFKVLPVKTVWEDEQP